MRFQFHARTQAAANFDSVFEESALCGLKLIGGSLWVSRHEDSRPHRLFVTLSARRSRGRFFDLLRSTSHDRRTIPDFEARVAAEYEAHKRSEGQPSFRAEAS